MVPFAAAVVVLGESLLIAIVSGRLGPVRYLADSRGRAQSIDPATEEAKND